MVLDASGASLKKNPKKPKHSGCVYVCSRGAERWFDCCSVTNREEKKNNKTRTDEPVRRGQEGERGRERDLRPVKVEERRGENKMKKKED